MEVNFFSIPAFNLFTIPEDLLLKSVADGVVAVEDDCLLWEDEEVVVVLELFVTDFDGDDFWDDAVAIGCWNVDVLVRLLLVVDCVALLRGKFPREVEEGDDFRGGVLCWRTSNDW